MLDISAHSVKRQMERECRRHRRGRYGLMPKIVTQPDGHKVCVVVNERAHIVGEHITGIGMILPVDMMICEVNGYYPFSNVRKHEAHRAERFADRVEQTLEKEEREARRLYDDYADERASRAVHDLERWRGERPRVVVK